MAVSAVSRGVVIDLEGELISHPNGSKWLRVLVTEETANSILNQLIVANDFKE